MKHIYLDQNVYSSFARDLQSGKIHPLHEQLRQLVQAGRVCIPFSIAHLSETKEAPIEETRRYILSIVEELSLGFQVTVSGAILKENLSELIKAFQSPIEFPTTQFFNMLPAVSPQKARSILEEAGLRPGNLNNLPAEKAIERINLILKSLNSEKFSQLFEDYKEESSSSLDKIKEQGISFLDSGPADFEAVMRRKDPYVESFLADMPPEFKIFFEEFTEDLINEGKQAIKSNNEKLKEQLEETFEKSKKDIKKTKISPSDSSYNDFLNKSSLVVSKHFSNPNAGLAFEAYLLSILGYFADKKERERQRTNLHYVEVWDTNHFMNALSCDAFIVQDGSLRERAYAVKKFHNLNLQICSMQEAKSIIEELIAI